MLPILHLNGYKIANPTVLARIPRGRVARLLEGYGYAPRFVSGDDPQTMHQLMAATLDHVTDGDRPDPALHRGRTASGAARWPMIVLRTPKGWTGPKTVDGLPAEGILPLPPGSARQPRQTGAPGAARAVAALLPAARALRRAWGAARGARGARPARRAPHGRDPPRQRRTSDARAGAARLPRLRRPVPAPTTTSEATRVLGDFLRDVMTLTRAASGSSVPTRRCQIV